MSDLAARRRIEKIITDYLLSMDVHIEDGSIEICPDLYGIEVRIRPRELSTTAIALDRLAEVIADELAHA